MPLGSTIVIFGIKSSHGDVPSRSKNGNKKISVGFCTSTKITSGRIEWFLVIDDI